MAVMNYSLADLFYDYGKEMMKHNSNSRLVGIRRFKSFFGVSPQICAMLWQLIKDELPRNYQQVHLLWALFFLKTYNTESINHCVAGCDEKTFRTKVWIVIDKLAFIKVVIWENRKINAKPGQTCFTSIDGVDCEINEPGRPFNPKWYSFKINTAGLRYEIGLCIRTGEIVWVNGGYPCGDWPDLKMARRFFVDFMDPGEKSLADKGYNDSKYFIRKTLQNATRHQRIMARHETVNKRLKQFNILCAPFRHDLAKHKICFYSIANITQLIIKYEEPLFSAC